MGGGFCSIRAVDRSAVDLREAVVQISERRTEKVRSRTVGKFVLPRDQARDGGWKQVRVSTVVPDRTEGVGGDRWVLIIAALFAAFIL